MDLYTGLCSLHNNGKLSLNRATYFPCFVKSRHCCLQYEQVAIALNLFFLFVLLFTALYWCIGERTLQNLGNCFWYFLRTVLSVCCVQSLGPPVHEIRLWYSAQMHHLWAHSMKGRIWAQFGCVAFTEGCLRLLDCTLKEADSCFPAASFTSISLVMGPQAHLWGAQTKLVV